MARIVCLKNNVYFTAKKAFKLLLSFRSLIKVYHHELPSLCAAAPPLKIIGKEYL